MNTLAWVSGGAFVLLAAVAVVGVVDYTTYTGDDPLIGLSMLMALAAGGVALLGGALTLSGWFVRRRRPSLAQGLAIAGTVILLMPAAGSALSLLFVPFY
jgi:hypothetical protein